MKLKSLSTIVVSVLFMVLASVGYSAPVLKMSSQWTENTPGGQVDLWGANEIKERTNGEINIKIFWEGALGKGKENLGLIQSGAIELAAMSPGYFPAELPFHAAPNSIPMAMSEVPQATELMERLLVEVPEFEAEAKRNGMKALFFHHLNPYKLVCKEPAMSVADMEGRKVRTWGKDMPRMVQAAGAVPVTLGLAELYDGLAKGTVDCIPFSVDLMVSYKIYEVAKHIHHITLWEGPTNAVWISSDIWEGFTDEQRAIVQELSFEAARRDRDQVLAAGEEAISILQEQGVQFHDFPAEEAEKWRNANPDFFGDFIADMTELGRGEDAEKTIMIWREVVAN